MSVNVADHPCNSAFRLREGYQETIIIIIIIIIIIVVAWGNTYATTLKSVVVLQKKAVRIITFSNRDAHPSLLFPQLGLIKLMDLVTIHTALFIFQYHYHLLPKPFDNFFSPTSSKHNYYTRLASKSTYFSFTTQQTEHIMNQ